jgi:PD-(D/E)XK endonuclease
MKTDERPERPQRERLINRRQQGDLGEFSAMEWLASQGALVWIPMGHSPDADLIAEIGGDLLKVQVKTSTQRLETSGGGIRWGVNIATNGGNQSWSGTTKMFDPASIDFLFALVGDGRRWCIPATVIEGARNITVGGTKYSEFEIERGQSFEHLVYSEGTSELDRLEGECLSGQKELAVNESAYAYAGSNPASPIFFAKNGSPHGDITKSERKLARSGHALLRQKRQITIPKRPCAEAGLRIGDRMRVRADGPGRIVFERAETGEPLSLE